MKKFIIILLVLLTVLFCSLLTSCSKEPIEEANEYISNINDEYLCGCSWRANINRANGEQIYEVWATLPFYSSSEFDYAGYEYAAIENINNEVYPNIERIIDKDDNIDHITIIFSYGNGVESRFISYDGKLIDMSDLLD